DINCHSYPEIEISVIGKIMAGIALSEDIDIGSIATPNADVVFVNTTDYDSIYNTICDWNFGDGSTASTCDELVEHTYLEPCRYFPYLVVQNRDLPECRDTAFFELAVNKRIDTVVNTSYFEYEWHTYYVSGEYLINMHSDNGCTYILILNITLPNDVAEYEKYGIDIYPNPTENFLRIISEMKMSAVEIISATGQLVMSSETNDSYVDFDVSSLNDGVYFVRIYGEDNVAPIVQKFIKE
ncbi:MAG: T9SS type A sorting domain-containing protein, partial [Bacteroidales bacterium]|nr:T9SS type A sorting domain-containing protein [Bacteroidales bacterium]